MGVEKAEWITLTVSERNPVQTSKTRIADIVIIGRDDGHTFCNLLQMLRTNARMQVKGEYQTLSAALQAGLGQTLSADFIIVLQSCSDEFAQHEINDLIGRLLFGRILCCYGPWCLADGRSHELWPVAFRVPAASAASLVELELLGFQADTPALFAMCAGEEVFARRSQFPDGIVPTVRSKAIVVSEDTDLRATVGGILAALNCECTELPMSVSVIRSDLASRNEGILLAIIDVDAPMADVQECLDVLDADRRIIILVGMSVFAASLCKSAMPFTRPPSRFVEKTELLLQLRPLVSGHG